MSDYETLFSSLGRPEGVGSARRIKASGATSLRAIAKALNARRCDGSRRRLDAGASDRGAASAVPDSRYPWSNRRLDRPLSSSLYKAHPVLPTFL